jgi:hypothetical protein
MDAQCFRVLRTAPRGEAKAVLEASGNVRRPAAPTTVPPAVLTELALAAASTVSILLCTVTFHANLAHSLTRSP